MRRVYHAVVDLEKGYDIVIREILRLALRRQRVLEGLNALVMGFYQSTKSRTATVVGTRAEF